MQHPVGKLRSTMCLNMFLKWTYPWRREVEFRKDSTVLFHDISDALVQLRKRERSPLFIFVFVPFIVRQFTFHRSKRTSVSRPDACKPERTTD